MTPVRSMPKCEPIDGGGGDGGSSQSFIPFVCNYRRTDVRIMSPVLLSATAEHKTENDQTNSI